ncbi:MULTISPECIES: DoxX family protein [unclassified Streptomyces]|uniref:DoxX family protein n=1 Tax=unclassified Streptomyces TaxID=2593676 RepID=UPI003328FA25
MFIAAVVLSSLLALLFCGAGSAKLAGSKKMTDQLAHLGVGPGLTRLIGAAQLLGAAGVLAGLWFGPLGVAAAFGLTALMAGAVIYHVRAGDSAQETSGAVIVLLLTLSTLVVRAASL